MTPREQYIRALFQLSKNTSPEVWDRFVMALGIYTADQIERVVSSAPSAEIPIAVGFVRYMREFRDEIRNIESVYQKMDKERKQGSVK